MAKQNVTFVERHVEKIVIGVCGAVLLAIAALYLVQNPHRVEVAGESLGPAAFYEQFRQKADEAVRRMRTVPPAPAEDPRIAQIINDLKPVQNDLPDQLEIAFVSPSPTVPDIGVVGIDKQIDLAKILPPNKPVGGEGSAGRSVAQIPPPTVILAEAAGAAPANANLNQLPVDEDTFWIALASSIDRKAQREVFEAAGYGQDRMALRIAHVDAERQMLLPSGEWGQAQIVEPYAPIVVGEPPQLTLVDPGDGTDPTVPPDQQSLLESFRGKFGSFEQQAQLLRPAFQPCLQGKDWWEWWVPKKLEHVDGDLSKDYGVVYPDEATLKPSRPGQRPGAVPPPVPRAPRGEMAGGEGAGRGGGPRGAAPGPGAPRPAAAKPAAAAAPADPAASGEAVKQLDKAEEAIKRNEFIEAAELLEAVIKTPSASEPIKKRAEKAYESIRTDLVAAYRQREETEKRKLAQIEMNFGPDVDPIWFTDKSVEPGKTYRYRIRLLALNNYAGLPNYLKVRTDATKVVLPGTWSEWSDQVTAKPAKQLFALKLLGDAVQLDLYAWSAGKWQAAPVKVGVGQPIVAPMGRGTVTYDATLSSIEQNRPYRERILNKKDGSIQYGEEKPTLAVVLVTSRGETEEHLVAEDSNRKKIFAAKKAEEDKLRAKLQDLQVSFQLPTGPSMMSMPGQGRNMAPMPLTPAPGGEGRGMRPGPGPGS